MKNRSRKTILLTVIIAFMLSGCVFISQNKIAGQWQGIEKVDGQDKTALSAVLDLTTDGSFTAKFTPAGLEAQEVKGTYTHKSERTMTFSPEEYGSILFQTEGSVKACSYRVTATTLYLNNWTDDQGQIRNLILFR